MLRNWGGSGIMGPIQSHRWNNVSGPQHFNWAGDSGDEIKKVIYANLALEPAYVIEIEGNSLHLFKSKKIQGNLCIDICETIFVILKVQFHHEGALSETRYFEIFSLTSLYLFPEKKLWHYLVQNLGHNHHKKSKIVTIGSSWSEKQPFTFRLFWAFKNPIEHPNS